MNLVQKAVQKGGKLSPLVISKDITFGTGLMNPSIFIDDDGDILAILRHTNYTLIHSENNQMFPSTWGPLAYAHPEKDPKLGTTNYLVRLDQDFKVKDYCLIDTSKLDVPPVWEFVGLEDARLVKWDNKYYAIGVRRDVKPNGEGRMELSELKIDKDNFSAKEISRIRIPAPGDNSSYCEKNWYPILDKPYHFVKWTSPTEIVKFNKKDKSCVQVMLSDTFAVPADLRGSSQMIRWDENTYISISHETYLYFNYLNQKDGEYRHRLCVWDNQFNLIGVSPEKFSFLDAKIEFCAGMAKYNDDVLISFGFQDNAAFILKVTNEVISEMIEEAKSYANN